MNKRFIFVILMLMVCFLATSCADGDQDKNAPIRTFEGGELYKSPSGSFYIAKLSGTFHQMGRQYGLLLKGELGAFYEAAVDEFLIGEKGVSYDDLAAAAQVSYDQFPQIFKDFLDGMAETNELDQEKTYILSTSLVTIFEAGCSSLSAWGDYTEDGAVVTGRNLDLPSETLRRFSKYFHVVVWNPYGWPASVAHIDFLGGLFYQTAINSKGIFLELQNGQNADPTEPEGRENANNILLESLFRNTSAEEVERWFQSTLPDAGLIMNASFPDRATIYEWATFRVAPRNADGLIAATNDFIDPSWVDYPIVFFDTTTEGIGLTVTRRLNLMDQGELNKGAITPQKMMQIFDMTIPEGAATFPEGGFIKTIYSVVAQPSTLKIWLKVRGYSGWEEIDLNKYFTE